MIHIIAALMVGLFLMPLPIYQVNAWGVGTVRVAHFAAAVAAGKFIWERRFVVFRGILRRLRGFLLDDRGFADASADAAIQALMSALEDKTRKDPPEVIHAGTQITLPAIPTRMSLKDGIAWLTKIHKDQESVVKVHEDINAYPLDGARAFTKAIQKRYGFLSAASMWDTVNHVSVATDVEKTELVAWGRFQIPGIRGTVECSSSQNNKGQLIFKITATVPKCETYLIEELAKLTREMLKTDSIYRGKAIKFTVDADGESKAPEFIDLRRCRPDELIFSSDVQDQIDTTIFAPIEKRDLCRKMGIPFKRGVCLMGRYGTGKTLAMYVAALKAIKAGITFIMVEDATQLPTAMQLARQYAPAVVSCEDVDRVTRSRDEVCNDIMDALDGVEAKDAEVMVLFTSNEAEQIHEAMRRPGRIDTFIKVNPPDAVAAEKLIRLYGRGLVDPLENISEPCRMLEGQIPAVVREVVERAKLSAVARAVTPEDASRITSKDLVVAARRMQTQQELFAPKVQERHSLAEAVEVLGQHMGVSKSNGSIKGNGHAARA